MIHDKTQGNLLIDFYGELLTDRQNEVLSHYYSDDLSMQEIADELGISKSAVSDLLHRSTSQLQEYKDKLKLISSYQKRNSIYEQLLALNDKRVLEYVSKLKNIDREEIE